MRAFAAIQPGPRRGLVVALVFLAAALLGAYELSGLIVNNDVVSLSLVLMVCVAGTFVLAILKNWRNGVYFLIAWLLFEDFVRKFLGNNMAIYFAKDILTAVVYLSFFLAYRKREKDLVVARPPFLPVLLVFIWFGVLQIFNPGSTTVFFGLMGMKLYFYYTPLFIIGYSLINSESDLRRFFYFNLGLMGVIAVLGIAQSVLGPTFLNPAAPAEDIRLLSQTYREAPISGVMVYRPTSVFVSTGRFGNMLVVSWMIVFGFSGYLLMRFRKGRIYAFLAVALIAAGCVMCASRGVFMWTLGSSIVGGIAFLWGAPWRQGEARRIFKTLQRAALGVALGMALLFWLFPEAFMNRLKIYSETLDPRSPANELVHRTRDYPLANFLGAFESPRWPYGFGIGTASLGGQYVTRIFQVAAPTETVESGFGCLVLEMGVVGLALWFILSGAVLFSAWKVVRKLRGSPWFPLAFMIFWYAFLLFLPFTFQGMQAYHDFVLNAYVWLLLGILFRLPKLALSAQAAAAPATSAAARVPLVTPAPYASGNI
ncbi:MAG TPA: hypothetical protein VMP12_06995 [Candidatus Sulfotelmatobacter sp.]|nr:hypothetical protein [Candidatus Sulfotelmatobacter sp.]